ncbi:MAG: hypothetical protein ACT4O2_16020, partial [Beijerinckiaceae bacterium]
HAMWHWGCSLTVSLDNPPEYPLSPLTQTPVHHRGVRLSPKWQKGVKNAANRCCAVELDDIGSTMLA